MENSSTTAPPPSTVTAAEAEALIPRFQFERVLNQDQSGRRITLLGKIDHQPSLLIIERAALPSDPSALKAFHASLHTIRNLGANDIYAWYLANVNSPTTPASNPTLIYQQPPRSSTSTSDLKLNLIYPCSEKHIQKYTPQRLHVVTETAAIYAEHVRPFIVRQREGGRLSWVFNILDGRTEQEDVLFRHTGQHQLGEDNEGFLLLPDMNWDRASVDSLRLLGVVERRDLWTLRDLRKKHVPWLKTMSRQIVEAVARLFPGVESDMLKLYFHYQPTYYHLHIHVLNVTLEPNATQAVGKAFSLPNLIAQLESMAGDDEEAGLAGTDLTYVIGEASELWTGVFAGLREGAGC